MVNNSTNINNHPLPQIIEHTKNPQHMTLEMQAVYFDMKL